MSHRADDEGTLGRRKVAEPRLEHSLRRGQPGAERLVAARGKP